VLSYLHQPVAVVLNGMPALVFRSDGS